MDTFNLLIEPWIPVLRTDGRFERVGIKQAFTEAGIIRQIAASNPMDRVAILRLLLAVLQWCKPTPTESQLEQRAAYYLRVQVAGAVYQENRLLRAQAV